MKILVLIAMTIALSGCGLVKRLYAHYTGDAAETCVKGVIYYQFTSGSSVAYNPDGSVRQCQ